MSSTWQQTPSHLLPAQSPKTSTNILGENLFALKHKPVFDGQSYSFTAIASSVFFWKSYTQRLQSFRGRNNNCWSDFSTIELQRDGRRRAGPAFQQNKIFFSAEYLILVYSCIKIKFLLFWCWDFFAFKIYSFLRWIYLRSSRWVSTFVKHSERDFITRVQQEIKIYDDATEFLRSFFN